MANELFKKQEIDNERYYVSIDVGRGTDVLIKDLKLWTLESISM